MVAKEKTENVTLQTEKDTTASYNTNPFSLMFDAMGRFIKYNTNWAVVLIVLGFFGVASQAGNLFHSATNSTAVNNTLSSNASGTVLLASIIVITVVAIAAIVGGLALNAIVQGMLSYVALQSEQGTSVKLGEAYRAAAARFWRLFNAQLLAFLKVIGWTLLFIVPGIIAFLRYSLLSYVIMSEPETEKGVVEAHNKVKSLVKGRLLEVLGVTSISSVIPVIGTLLGLSGNAALYTQLALYNSKDLEKPKISWINYLILACGLILVIGLIIGSILLAINQA